MKKKKSDDLIKRLINNQISREEMETLLEGMDDEESIGINEAYLKSHFDQIMDEYIYKKEGGK
ncbi:MAG: hypothetical protein WD426_19565 [Anditalea sp.]